MIWMLNLHKCRDGLPEHLKQSANEKEEIRVALPIWHGNIHEPKCKTTNSIQYQEGGAAVDGETMQRIWSILNTTAYATKEMTEGNWEDTLEDKLDRMNFKKNLGLGKWVLIWLCSTLMRFRGHFPMTLSFSYSGEGVNKGLS